MMSQYILKKLFWKCDFSKRGLPNRLKIMKIINITPTLEYSKPPLMHLMEKERESGREREWGRDGERDRKQKIVTQAKDTEQSLLTQPPKLIQITGP